MTRYYDIGLNLFCRQFSDPEKILRDAENAGVFCILTGSDMEENRTIVHFLPEHNVYGTAGIHPHNADRATPKDIEEIRVMQEHPQIVAIGECGLDFDRMFSKRENQIWCLEQHINLAESTGKPMFLHERCASRTMVELFSSHPEVCRRSVIHCFTGNREELETYLRMGFYIGITGWICDDRRAQDLRDAVAILPPDRVMIETDAPYLTPRNVPGLGRTNVPQNLVYVLRTLAEYMHMDEVVLRQLVKANTERFFSLPVTEP